MSGELVTVKNTNGDIEMVDIVMHPESAIRAAAAQLESDPHLKVESIDLRRPVLEIVLVAHRKKDTHVDENSRQRNTSKDLGLPGQ